MATLGFSEAKTSDATKLVPINTLPWSRVEIANAESNAPNKILRAEYDECRTEDNLVGNSDKFAAKVEEPEAGVFRLSNNDLAVQIENGVITSLVDLKAKREIIPTCSRASQFVVFDDKPLYWQAWDVEVYHLDSRQELDSGPSRVSERGPRRVSVVSETKIGEISWARTTISLAASVEGYPSYVEIESEVEWQESMKFLKVEFPVEIRNTEASYETQYGIVRRPTHYNTR